MATTVSKRSGRVMEDSDYIAMMRRLARRLGERVADGDPETLTEMLDLYREFGDAVGVAVRGQREQHNFSWSEIGRGAGMTKQGAQQRWGK